MKSYTDLIDQALLLRQSEDESNYFPLRPSAAGYHSCRLAHDLASYLGFVPQEKEVKTPEVMRLLNFGSSVEWHSISNFGLIPNIDPDIKIKFKQQSVTLFRLQPAAGETTGRLIEGSIDLAVQDGEFLDIVDIKSLKDAFSVAYKTRWEESKDKFNKLSTLERFAENSWYAKDLPSFLEELKDPWFEHNFHQVNAYANTQWFKDHNGRDGGVYRYCKNDSRHIEIRFKPHSGMFQELEAKFNNIYKTVLETKNPSLVKKECWLGSPVTAFSPCARTCWKEDCLKAYFKTFPKKEWPTDITPGSELDKYFAIYEQSMPLVKEQEQNEENILKLMVENELTKVKLPNGGIYEAKHLKSPRPHFELRKGKL